MKYFILFITILTVIILTSACGNLEKTIDLELPEYESELVVECYLEPGKRYKMTLTESIGYFEGINRIPWVKNANITIMHQGEEIKLRPPKLADNIFFPNSVVGPLPPDNNVVVVDTLHQKIYNYIATQIVPENYDSEFILNVTDSFGRTVTASTQILKKPVINEVEQYFRDKDTSAYLLIHFFDVNAGKDNYYRRVIHKDSLDGPPQTAFAFSDGFGDGDEIITGTGYDFKPNDTAFVAVYHIEKAYYEFLESSGDAANANGNPFAQPSLILSNIEGGTGIFTGLSYDRQKIIIKKPD